jgi:hypothetical protein
MSDQIHGDVGPDELGDDDIARLFDEGFRGPKPDPEFASTLKHRLDVLRSASENSAHTNSKRSLAESSPQRRHGSWRKFSWGFAAAVAAVLLMVLWPAGTAYSFEVMRDRLSDAAFVRAKFVEQGRAHIGWLSAAGDFSAVESEDSVAVATQRGTWTRFDRQTKTLERQSLGGSSTTAQIRVLKVLGALQNESTSSLQVARQSWQAIDLIDGADVQLDVRFLDSDAPSGTMEVQFGIDSKSGLPVWIDMNSVIASGSSMGRVSLAYPKQGPSQLASLGIPAELARRIVNGNPLMPSTDSVALGGKALDPDSLLEPDELATPVIQSQPLGDASEDTSDPKPENTKPIAQSIAEETTDPKDLIPLVSTRRWAESMPVEVAEDPASMAKQIDQHLAEVWSDLGVMRHPPADAYTLYRRMHLDLTGRIPRVAEIRDAVSNGKLDADSLLGRMLDSPDFDSNMAAIWTRWLLPPDVELAQFGGKSVLEAWLADQFTARVSYDQIARELLTAEGRVGDPGPVLFTTALEMKPDHLAKQTARTFLGTRIDCAMCHDHPYDAWTQTDFWGYAALFARINRPNGKMNTMSSVLRVKDVGEGEVTFPDSDQVVPPRLLGAGLLVEEPGSDQRRKKLADWLTSSGNRQFARATVNLLWSHFFGAGLVEPRDDFGPHNPALSPELLEALAQYFVASDYDVRSVVRAIVLSEAYQSTSQVDQDMQRPHFNVMPIRWLTAEQLYDCLLVASGGYALDGNVAGGSLSDPALGIDRVGDSARAAFVQQFGSSATTVLEYQAGIPQALSLMNGPLSNLSAGESTSRLLRGLNAPFFSEEDRIETVFLSLVGRPPSTTEAKAVSKMLDEKGDSSTAEVLSDLVWALLNGAEFATNH